MAHAAQQTTIPPRGSTEPGTKIPGCRIGCVPIIVIPCGIIWKGRRNGVVKIRTINGLYLGTSSMMQVDSWREYNRRYKRRSFCIEIDCSASVQFSENAFKEGYYWGQDYERWVLSDNYSDDGDDVKISDEDYYDPMDNCVDCGYSRCPCQYYNRRR